MNNIKEKIEIIGTVKIEHLDQFLNPIKTIIANNLVVTPGKNYIASRMKDTTYDAMSHIGLGSSSITVVTTDTILGSQISARVPLLTTTVTGNTISYYTTFGPGVCTGTISEAGIFNNISSGTMLSRIVFGTVTKAILDTVNITWDITFVI